MRIHLALILLLPFLVVGCNEHGLSPVAPSELTTGFSGTVTFLGEWPRDAKECWIVVLKDMPETPSEAAVAILQAPKDSIPLFSTSYPYFFSVPPGRYEIVFVALLRQGQFWGLNSVVGVYFEDGDSTRTGNVFVLNECVTRDINITVDFAHIPVVIPGLPTKGFKKWTGVTEQ